MSTNALDAGGLLAERVPFRRGELRVLSAGHGRGPRVGYLHGLLGHVATPPLLTALASDHEVVAPCLPGFSGSTACDDLRHLYDWVVAVSEVLDATGLDGCPVVASSVGAMLALELAAVRPEAFSSMVLVAPLGLWDDVHPVGDPFASTLSEQRAMLTADPDTVTAFWEPPEGADNAARVDAEVERYLTRRSAASLVWPIAEHGLTTRIHRIRVPVTIVWGTADRLAPASYADTFSALLGDAPVHLVDGAGHLADLDAPGTVAAIVRDALRRSG